MTIWLAEITGHDGEGPVVHRFATRGYTTRRTDVPESVHYEAALQIGALFDRSVEEVATGGAVVVINANGEWDHLRGQGFGGHPLRLLRVADEHTPYAEAVEEIHGTQREPEWGVAEILFRLRERMADLDVPLQPARFAGDGAPGALLSLDLAGVGLPEGVTFARASAATDLAPDGTPLTFAADVPRQDGRGLLIEEAYTPLLAAPADLSDASWTKTGGTAPAADEWHESSFTQPHGWSATAPVTSGDVSAFADLERVAGQQWARLYITVGGAGGRAWYDLVNGVVGTVENVAGGTGTAARMEAIGAGIWRCFFETTPGAPGTATLGYRGASADGSTANYLGTGGLVVRAHRQQLESGRPSSSWTGAARAADVATVALADGDYEILVRRERTAAWVAASVAGGGWAIPADRTDPRVRQVAVWYAGDLTVEQKAEILAADVAGGLEGGAELTDRAKPMGWGEQLQVPLLLLNAGLLVYGANCDAAGDRAPCASMAVSVGGVPLIHAGDHADADALLASTGLVVNGTFDADADWDKGSGWTIAGGVAAKAAGAAADLAQAQALVDGAGYVLTAIVTVGAGSLQFKIGGTAIGDPVAATGPVVRVFSGAAGDLILSADAAFAGSVDDVRLVRIGTYETCLAESLARLAGMPGGKVTADIVEGATSADRCAAGLARRIALAAGVPPEAIDDAAFDALAAAAPAPVGLFLADGETAAAAMRRVAAAIDAVPFFRRDRVLSIGRRAAPAGEPVTEIEEADLVDALQLLPWTPVWRHGLDYAPYWTTQSDGELAGSVPPARRVDLGRDWRTAWAPAAEDLRVKHPGAAEIRAESLLARRADALAEAQRRLDRDAADRLPVIAAVCRTCAGGVELFATVRLWHRRYGLHTGRLYQVRSIRETDTALLLTLWG